MIPSARNCCPLRIALAAAGLLAAFSTTPAWGAEQDASSLIAIDVLLKPSAEMAQFAEAANKGLRKEYPEGYALGERQAPHISLVHCYVRAGDLPALEAKLAAVFAENNPLIVQLTATGYEHSGGDDLALMVIAIERSAALDRVQAKVAAAIEPFAAENGSAAAFAVNEELPEIDPSVVDYVRNFRSSASGKNYRPHITVGLVHENVAKDVEAIGFPRRSFRASGAAIYQLGNYGTAQKELWTWTAGDSRR